jgi:TPR repeat protein
VSLTSLKSSWPGNSPDAASEERPHITGATKIVEGEAVEDQKVLPPETQRFLEELENIGHEGEYALGTVYLLGLLGVERDTAESARLYRKAADARHVESQYVLGLMYEEGQGVPRDLSQAAWWHGKAAGQGHAGAQFSLGLLRYRGAGVPKDRASAAEWFLRAAESGNIGARFCLGLLYFRGEGVPQDHSEGARWYREAESGGSAYAGYGSGLPRYYDAASRKNNQAAVEWFYEAGRSYLEKGDRSSAAVSLQAIQEISPDDPLGRKLIDQLRAR